MRSAILIALLLKAVASTALVTSRHGGTFGRGAGGVTMLTQQQNAAYGGHPPHGERIAAKTDGGSASASVSPVRTEHRGRASKLTDQQVAAYGDHPPHGDRRCEPDWWTCDPDSVEVSQVRVRTSTKALIVAAAAGVVASSLQLPLSVNAGLVGVAAGNAVALTYTVVQNVRSNPSYKVGKNLKKKVKAAIKEDQAKASANCQPADASPAVVVPTPGPAIPPKIGVAKTRAAAKAPGPEAETDKTASGSALDRQLEAMGLDLAAVEAEAAAAAPEAEFNVLVNLKATLERARKPRPRFSAKAKAIKP